MSSRWRKTFGGSVWCAAALVISPHVGAAAPSAAMLVNPCSSCHGALGASAGLTLPSLAGLPKTLVIDAMQEFKRGVRPSSVMGRIAKAYTDEDFAVMGDYFASQKRHVTKQNLDPERVAKGAKLFPLSCGGSACHVVVGRSTEDDPPAVASQWLGYLQIQMDLYVNGQRKMPMRMGESIKALSAADRDALLHYFASVQ
ncbi:MAG: soxE [Comamonadaceae bacterium]|nr:MAG: soxE [Comamonadaceae bacterium]